MLITIVSMLLRPAEGSEDDGEEDDEEEGSEGSEGGGKKGKKGKKGGAHAAVKKAAAAMVVGVGSLSDPPHMQVRLCVGFMHKIVMKPPCSSTVYWTAACRTKAWVSSKLSLLSLLHVSVWLLSCAGHASGRWAVARPQGCTLSLQSHAPSRCTASCTATL